MNVATRKTHIDYAQLDNSKLRFPKKIKEKSIFHYTSIGGLEGILGQKKLRFTNIKYMNDKDEIIAGIDSLAKLYDASEENRQEMYSTVFDCGTQTFVCCFSLEEDSLPMWNYYTKEVNNQGYNIELNVQKLIESILRENKALDGCNLSFGIVEYCKDNESQYSKTANNAMLTVIDAFISNIFLIITEGALANESSEMAQASLQDFKQVRANLENERKMSNLPVYFYNGESCSFEKNLFGDYLYFVKRHCFKPEREFRIVITVPDEHLAELKQQGVYKFRSGNGILIPFLELDFALEAIKSITISPTMQSDLVELSLRDFLKFQSFQVEDYTSFIRHSKIPVRF